MKKSAKKTEPIVVKKTKRAMKVSARKISAKKIAPKKIAAKKIRTKEEKTKTRLAAAKLIRSLTPADRKKIQTFIDDKAELRARADGWTNILTGMGTFQDKTMATRFGWFEPLAWVEIEALYYGDAIAARIINDMPEDMYRRGFCLEGEDGSDDLKSLMDDFGVEDKFERAEEWARAYGGAAIVIGADDGLDPMYPLNVAGVRSVKFLNVVDRRYIYPVTYYQDPMSPKFGEPEVYQVVSALGGIVGFVHETRMLRFVGAEVDPITARRLGGWGYSVLQRAYTAMQKFAAAYDAASQLMIDAGQAVFKIQGLINQITNGEEQTMLARMQSVDSQRSSGRAVVLDSESEEFERQPVQLASIPEMLDRMASLLASAAGEPLTKLMGRSPAGMNATGDSDLELWYDSVQSKQRKRATPKIRYLAQIMTAGKWKGTVVFPPLKDPDELRQAQIDFQRAQTWKIYSVDIKAIQPEQVALAEFGDTPIEIDVEAYKKIVDIETKAALEEAKNPPPPPPAFPPPGQPGGQKPGDPNGSTGTPPTAKAGPPPAVPTPTG